MRTRAAPTPKVLRAVGIALTALLVAGCGGGDGGSSDAPQPSGASDRLETYELASHGFAIGVPESWQAVSAEIVAESEAVKELARRNPAVKPFVDAVRRPSSPLKFVALDSEGERGFAANVNVVVEPLPQEMTLDEYREALLRQLAASGIAEGSVDRDEVELSAGRATRLAYEADYDAAGPGETVRTLQYAIVSGEEAYVVTYSTLPDQAGRYADDFDASIRSFRLL